MRFHLDVRGFELVLEQRQGLGDDLVQVDFVELRGAGAREVQQVVHYLRGAERLARNLFQQRGEPGIAIDLLGGHLRVAGDYRERRVDFVRHSSGQQTDGRELFRLAEL